jgi:biotin operon repressor
MDTTTQNQDELKSFMKTMADPERIKIAGLLGVETLSVTEISERLGMKPSEVQRHLDQLTENGLAFKEGSLYRLNVKAVEKLTRQVLAQSHPPAPEYEGDEFEVKTLRSYIARDGSLKSIPTQQKKLMVILKYLARDFMPGVRYTESQVNQMLRKYHEDTAALRRYMVDNGLLEREKGIYWSVEPA